MLQIRSSLPFSWRRLLINPASPGVRVKPKISTPNKSCLDISTLSSKRIYSTLILFRTQPVAAQKKWILDFPVLNNQSDQFDPWEHIYKTPFKIARETKFQSFQFKLLHRIIPCGKYLKNIRIRDSDTCDLCGGTDTLAHFFFDCPVSNQFWQSVCNWFHQQVDVRMYHISRHDFMFGVPRGHPQYLVVNFIVLFCKFHIYRQKLLHGGALDITMFL